MPRKRDAASTGLNKFGGASFHFEDERLERGCRVHEGSLVRPTGTIKLSLYQAAARNVGLQAWPARLFDEPQKTHCRHARRQSRDFLKHPAPIGQCRRFGSIAQRAAVAIVRALPLLRSTASSVPCWRTPLPCLRARLYARWPCA